MPGCHSARAAASRTVQEVQERARAVEVADRMNVMQMEKRVGILKAMRNNLALAGSVLRDLEQSIGDDTGASQRWLATQNGALAGPSCDAEREMTNGSPTRVPHPPITPRSHAARPRNSRPSPVRAGKQSIPEESVAVPEADVSDLWLAEEWRQREMWLADEWRAMMTRTEPQIMQAAQARTPLPPVARTRG